ncbi:NERD domain-containing protein [Citrifermentans bremense]|uniref:NERD domain-containing protein n=1 Tax=Citrifermentans bremense TaxID=60035 RepID=UPI00047C5FF6|nr:NERD domain-containing protein [Citrifermentans bremense]
MTIKAAIKGWFGEAQVTLAKKLFLDSEIYVDLNNVTIPAANGTTQIDHIIVSLYGIFIVETKNVEGWIFGDAKGPSWTQNLFGKKSKFQNPLHQNYKHIKTLSDFLGIDEGKFHSLVFFTSDCTFKTELPPNVMNHGYIPYIKSKTDVHFTPAQVQEIISSIKTGMKPKTWSTRKEHVAGLKERFNSTTICPKCSKELKLRTVKSGENAGSQFYGCSGFPKCRYTKPVDD